MQHGKIKKEYIIYTSNTLIHSRQLAQEICMDKEGDERELPSHNKSHEISYDVQRGT